MNPLGGWTFAHPAALLFLAALPAIAWLRTRRGQAVFVIPYVARWSTRIAASRSRMPVALVNVALVLLVIALARPQKIEAKRLVHQQGYDIMLAIDLSGSMLAEDYESGGKRINRLQAIKPIIEAFMARRPTDRIGVVTFGGRAYTLAPLTADHDWLRQQLGRLKVGLIEDGTAIGDALALAVARLGQPAREEHGQRKGGFIVLLTDGASNAGSIVPQQAAELAKAKGIPIYTIGAGRDGAVPMPVFDEGGRKLGYQTMLSDLDEHSLEQIADLTGGKYFRAMDSDTVDAAFAAIDREHKIEFDAKSNIRAQELFQYAAWPGLALFVYGLALARPGRQGAFA